MKLPLLALGGLLLAGCCRQTLTLESLLREMTDREAITRYPEYRLVQATSWDRTQTGPDHPETWFNNVDYGYFIRKESRNGKDEFVILDEKGPGCIVRWQIPLEYTYRDRVVRVYLDGAAEPVIEENYHRLLSGQSFVGWPFAFISSDETDSVWQEGLPAGHPKQMGANFYLPIPFATSCKITLSDNPFYYSVACRIYPPGTRMESFSRTIFDRCRATVEQTARLLGQADVCRDNLTHQARLLPGDSLRLSLPVGSQAVQRLSLQFGGPMTPQALRSSILRIAFDREEPVWCPVSEFFGGGVYLRPAGNRDFTVLPGGRLESRWIMPYRDSATVALVNLGKDPVEVSVGVSVRSFSWDEKTMYFHAGWHEEAPIRTRKPIDWNYARMTGKGVYAGDVLTIHAFSKGWWGEGDEKMYLDGEKFPSIIGTGLEDYYGYSWGMAHVFSSPFESVPLRDARGKGDWRGYTTVSRVRLLDAIPFRSSLDVNVEAWLHDSTVSYSNAVFWYGLPGATSNRKAEPEAVRRILPAFDPGPAEEKPGKPYPDPAAGGTTPPLGNGLLKHAGNQPDCLAWRSTEVAKPLDPDGDNRLGTAGYWLPGCRRLDPRPIRFSEDSVNNLPVFAGSIKVYEKTAWTVPNAWLADPDRPGQWFITGRLSGECPPGGQVRLLTIPLRDGVPETFTLGVMTDNLDTFMDGGSLIRVTASSGGDSGWVPMVRSNRLPDWYFFLVRGCRSGDALDLLIRCGPGEHSTASVGAITFDMAGHR